MNDYDAGDEVPKRLVDVDTELQHSVCQDIVLACDNEEKHECKSPIEHEKEHVECPEDEVSDISKHRCGLQADLLKRLI